MSGGGPSPGSTGEEAQVAPNWSQPSASARTYALSAFSAIMFVAGLFVAQPLIFLSVPVTLFLIFSALRARDPRSDIRVERSTERVQIREGESTRVRLRVRNLGGRDVDLLQVADGVDSGLRSRRTRSCFSVSLAAGETKDLYYEVTAASFGIRKLGPIDLRAQDSTGLFESEARLDSFTKVIILPECMERITHLAMRPRNTKPWPGVIMARRAGSGLDYYSVRRFAPGDPMKHVNWRASAKQSDETEPLINERIAEVGAEVLVVVDAGAHRTLDSIHGPDVVQTVKAAMSIAERLLRDRNRVGLLTTGVNARRIPTGYGKRQFDRMAMSLVQLESGDSDFQWWVECSIHLFFPNISQVIFVSTLASPESLAAAAGLTKHAERDVIVVSPNPVEAAARSAKAPESRERKVALKMAELERRAEISRLQAANILVVDWTTSESLEELMELSGRALSRYAVLTARRG